MRNCLINRPLDHRTPAFAVVITLLTLVIPDTTHAAGSSYEAAYKLSVSGLTIAKMKRRFELDELGKYRFISEIEATGLVSLMRSDKLKESSSGQLVDGQFLPAEYSYVRRNKRKPRSVATTFDYGEQVIDTVYNGESYQQELTPGVLDKLVYQAVLAHDLASSKDELRYVISDRGEAKIYEPIVAGEELIDTKIGRLETIKVVREKAGDSRRTVFWCARDLDYLPVRVAHRDKGGTETIVEITRYEILN